MSSVAATKMIAEIHPARVRYIKLGSAGHWQGECIKGGIVQFGFDSTSAERFALCRAGKWDALTKSFLAAGKTRFTNETRLFFEDDGTTLWITFVGERLYWGFLTRSKPEPHSDGDGGRTWPLGVKPADPRRGTAHRRQCRQAGAPKRRLIWVVKMISRLRRYNLPVCSSIAIAEERQRFLFRISYSRGTKYGAHRKLRLPFHVVEKLG